jgi:hypothetical protein
MAELFLTKDGSSHDASRRIHLPIETVAEKLTPFEKRYFDAPPDIKPDEGHAEASARFRNVIVRIGENETNAVFPDAGYYHVPHLTADDCRRLFGISVQ